MRCQTTIRKKSVVYFVLLSFAGPAPGQAPPAAPAAPVASTVNQTQGEAGTRGLFMLALIPVFAQMVGMVGTNLIEALFAPRPPRAPSQAAADASPPAAPKPTVPLEQLAVNGNYYAGVAYATYLVAPDSEPVRVDAATYQFRTGDQFIVRYVANMPGRMDVSNVNPRGQETALGTWPVVSGEQVTMPSQGAFQFNGSAGDEGLRFYFTPCTSGVPTRDISMTAAATVNYGTLLPSCNARTTSTRDITVSAENGMGYAVSQLDKPELDTKSVETRVFMVRFRHTAAAAASRDWLVTPEEADQARTRQLVPNKSDPDGPVINVRVPGEIKEVKPPVTIDVAFEPKDGQTVDLKTLKVTYLKLFDIDITDRMKPYLTPTGIYSQNAKLPPGEHTIEISVKDTAGRTTVELFSFKVLKP